MIRAAIMACALLGALAGSPAHAQRGAAECEKISDAHAYNQCLAAAGPASRAAGASATSGQRPSARSSRAKASEARTSSRRSTRSRATARRDVNVRRLPSGRMRMEITAPRR